MRLRLITLLPWSSSRPGGFALGEFGGDVGVAEQGIGWGEIVQGAVQPNRVVADDIRGDDLARLFQVKATKPPADLHNLTGHNRGTGILPVIPVML